MTLDEASELTYPLFARPKLRGVYIRIVNGEPVRLDGKPIVNQFVTDILRSMPPFEGTLLMGETWSDEDARATEELLDIVDMAERFVFWVHDIAVRAALPFNQRLPMMGQWVISSHSPAIRPVAYKLIHTPEGLLAYEAANILADHPGVATMDPDARYVAPTSQLN